MEGKKTLIAIHALNKGVELKIFGKGEATSEEINEAVNQLEEAGSIDYVSDLALGYIAKGKELLDIVGDSESKTILMAIADYMITRSY
jgi:geranylgeranyl diphosphate synthase type I